LQSHPKLEKATGVKAVDCFLEDLKKPFKAPELNLPTLQSLMWENVGIIRSGKDLKRMAEILAAWHRVLPKPTDRATFELANMIITARLMTEAALTREESRGAHFRTDFPDPLPEWEKHIIFKNRE
jgi:L-aspartate oxidase